MRISDWSSDVCSSDLVDDEGGQRRRRHGADADAGDRPARGLAAAQNDPALYRADRRHIGKADADADAEIGRASCRDRVCQYGSISVVAESLTKKKGNTSTRSQVVHDRENK